MDKIINNEAADSKLEKLKEECLEPVYIEDPEIGKLTLNREHSWFEGCIDWLGYNCKVHLETDTEGGESANSAFSYLKLYYANKTAWDDEFRTCISLELIEAANEFTIRDEAIREDELKNMIRISEISINPQGNITAYYINDEGLFGEHVMMVLFTIDGFFKNVDLLD